MLASGSVHRLQMQSIYDISIRNDFVKHPSQINLVMFIHEGIIKWKHFPRYWPFVHGIHRSPVNSPHKGQWRGALMRRHRAHYDVIVMNDFDSDEASENKFMRFMITAFRWGICLILTVNYQNICMYNWCFPGFIQNYTDVFNDHCRKLFKIHINNSFDLTAAHMMIFNRFSRRGIRNLHENIIWWYN